MVDFLRTLEKAAGAAKDKSKVRKKIVLLTLIAVVSLLLTYLQRQTQRFAHKQGASTGFPPAQLPYKWVGNISPIKANEASGIACHPQRKTIFVVGNEGDLYEMRADGKLVRKGRLEQADLEGITVNPTTGFLYVVVEGEEAILEITPETCRMTRKSTVNRIFKRRELLKKGGQGLEGVVFIPDASHPEAGAFWVGNQSFNSTARGSKDLKSGKEPSIICEIFFRSSHRRRKEQKDKLFAFFRSPSLTSPGSPTTSIAGVYL
jgi:uncharacterized protein YjiK